MWNIFIRKWMSESKIIMFTVVVLFFFCFHCEVYQQWLFSLQILDDKVKLFRVFEKFIWFFDISAYRSETFKGRTGTKSIMQKDVMVWLTKPWTLTLTCCLESYNVQFTVEILFCWLKLHIMVYLTMFPWRIRLQQNTFLLN